VAAGDPIREGERPRRRLRLLCRGAVQGVGFRPFVHRLATSLGLSGFVQNGPEGVRIEVEGALLAVAAFAGRLPKELPPLARLDELLTEELSPRGESAFVVLLSEEGARRRALVPPDSALCFACRAEMEDPRNPRHRYPFTTCTDCGPRFSLVRNLPYDRERTSMACFPLCRRCRKEYEDPADRRFHAEPVCCPDCGPRLWLADASAKELAEGATALAAAREALGAGRIVAVKGLGGFQLACRADDEAAVSELRRRKNRPSKPFAVMAAGLDIARLLVRLSPAEEELLAPPRAPVLLAPAAPGSPLAPSVAPGLGDVGVLLPTAPIHAELFRGAPYQALVMTSGNASDEPICKGNREALQRLRDIADLFLLHDRDVVRRVDDSVARTGDAGPFLVRRARGYVPDPLPLPEASPAPVLALGGHLQNTACLAVGPEAFPSQHVGDLDTAQARAFLDEAARGLEEFLQARAEILVVDAHPDYPSTWLGERLAAERGAALIRVQHHVAHAAATLAEHGAFPDLGARAAALILDGTGWGTDGTAWGGEWLSLHGDLRWKRLAHLAALPLVGGEAAVREPWRVAVAALAREGAFHLAAALPLFGQVEPAELESVASLSGRGGWPLATGAGRLFEAAGALLGLAAVNGYEGEAAARLEAEASRAAGAAAPWPEVSLSASGHERSLPSSALLAALARRAAGGEPPAEAALGFHVTFARLAAELTASVLEGRPKTLALGGGCMVNRILRRELFRGLQERGFRPLLPVRVPPGDGGLAYGQAVLGALSGAREIEPEQKE
jgi:hydrogenase maturation protein HypF